MALKVKLLGGLISLDKRRGFVSILHRPQPCVPQELLIYQKVFFNSSPFHIVLSEPFSLHLIWYLTNYKSDWLLNKNTQ